MKQRVELPKLDAKTYVSDFEKESFVSIPDFLPFSLAERLQEELSGQIPWELSYLSNGRVKLVSMEEVQASSKEALETLEEEIRIAQSTGFQFRYCSYPIGARLTSAEWLPSVHREWLPLVFNEEFTCFLRTLCKNQKVKKHNLQAAYYPPGGFLMPHDDVHPAANRSCAFILQLSKNWQKEWGGNLEFLDEEGEVLRQCIPQFNNLIVFRVPQIHRVSRVSEVCGGKRLSLHGWGY